MHRWCALALGCVLVGGCAQPAQITAETKEVEPMDVLAGLRQKGWKIDGESVKQLPSGSPVLSFVSGDVLFVTFTKAKGVSDGPLMDSDSVGSYKKGLRVITVPLFRDSGQWNSFCSSSPEKEQYADLCAMPFENKMKLVKQWQDGLLKDAEEVITELSTN